jgi:hypothetical protein
VFCDRRRIAIRFLGGSFVSKSTALPQLHDPCAVLSPLGVISLSGKGKNLTQPLFSLVSGAFCLGLSLDVGPFAVAMPYVRNEPIPSEPGFSRFFARFTVDGTPSDVDCNLEFDASGKLIGAGKLRVTISNKPVTSVPDAGSASDDDFEVDVVVEAWPKTCPPITSLS